MKNLERALKFTQKKVSRMGDSDVHAQPNKQLAVQLDRQLRASGRPRLDPSGARPFTPLNPALERACAVAEGGKFRRAFELVVQNDAKYGISLSNLAAL